MAHARVNELCRQNAVAAPNVKDTRGVSRE